MSIKFSAQIKRLTYNKTLLVETEVATITGKPQIILSISTPRGGRAVLSLSVTYCPNRPGYLIRTSPYGHLLSDEIFHDDTRAIEEAVKLLETAHLSHHTLERMGLLP